MLVRETGRRVETAWAGYEAEFQGSSSSLSAVSSKSGCDSGHDGIAIAKKVREIRAAGSAILTDFLGANAR
eukprot:4272303-Pleurochrysis_carterae.AAC.3